MSDLSHPESSADPSVIPSSYEDSVVTLAASNESNKDLVRFVDDPCPSSFTWVYDVDAASPITRLYEKAKRNQWNASTDIDWSQPVDPEQLAALAVSTTPAADLELFSSTPAASWGEKEWVAFSIESQCWAISQFLHGEQGALLVSAKLTEVVPDIESKYYAATQTMDEARHVEVFHRYLSEKLPSSYPVNPHLQSILDDVIAAPDWDISFLGMQVMVEGLALAAFGFMRALSPDPLLQEMLRYVMSDEARHVAFGVTALKPLYAEMSSAELQARAELVFEWSLAMRNRFLQQEVWERLGVPPASVVEVLSENPAQLDFRRLLFSKIVPNCRKLGLLDVNDSWLRHRFEELKVIEFEPLPAGDEFEEYQLAD